MRLPVAQRRIALLWFVGSGLAFFLLLAQTWGGVFEAGGLDLKDPEAAEKAWRWFAGMVVPTLSLMIGAYGQQVGSPKSVESKHVPRPLAHIALWLSLSYLALLIAVIGRARWVDDPIALQQQSALYLGLLQGLVGASLGVLFTAASPNPGEPSLNHAAQAGGEP